ERLPARPQAGAGHPRTERRTRRHALGPSVQCGSDRTHRAFRRRASILSAAATHLGSQEGIKGGFDMRSITKALAAATLLLAGATAQAQDDFPNKQINIIVPYPPGGLADLLTRSIAQGLEQAWNQTVIVENKPGAGGILGAQTV